MSGDTPEARAIEQPGARPAARPAGGLFAALWELLRTPVPPERRGYLAFGWLILLLFAGQIVTGALLSVYYEPDAGGAASSVRYIMREVGNGWLVRGLHYWSSTAIVALALLQLGRVLATRAYRLATGGGAAWCWSLGFLLFGLIFLQGFTGKLLRWDDEAYWTASIWLQKVERVPLVGELLAALLRGGPEVAGHTLSRAYALHVMLVPWLSLVIVALNLWMLARHRRQQREAAR